MIEQLLSDSLQAAMEKLREHCELVAFRDADGIVRNALNVSESTLRSFVLAELMHREHDARCQTEWTKSRYDLLVTIGDQSSIIEFKFYGCCRGYAISGDPKKWKGFPSKKNWREFCECIEKLQKANAVGVSRKFLVLVYQKGRPTDWGAKKLTYDELYGKVDGLAVRPLDLVPHSWEDHFACKQLEVT